ncbi:MAG: hypothetical protein Q7S52_00630 [bacterium]|nr:hypothetical protein [bacterium]
MLQKKIFIGAGIGIALLGGIPFLVSADHSWGGYHWARTANPLTLSLGDNLSSAWDPYLVTTSSDWSISSALDTTIVPGTAFRHRSPNLDCGPVLGTVQVCNKAYGKNGWLGIASVWVSGDHITQGTTKLNDTYFKTTKYNTPEWKNFVMCQEVGHTIGLDHQDEAFDNANLDTCMDYTSNPATNQHPNAHDYAMLEEIYAHVDTTATALLQSPASAGAEAGEHPGDWGREVRKSKDGNVSLYVKELKKGESVFTFVVWAN